MYFLSPTVKYGYMFYNMSKCSILFIVAEGNITVVILTHVPETLGWVYSPIITVLIISQ